MRLGCLYVVLVDEDEEAGGGQGGGQRGASRTGISSCFELVTAAPGISSHDGNPTVWAAQLAPAALS